MLPYIAYMDPMGIDKTTCRQTLGFDDSVSRVVFLESNPLNKKRTTATDPLVMTNVAIEHDHRFIVDLPSYKGHGHQGHHYGMVNHHCYNWYPQ